MIRELNSFFNDAKYVFQIQTNTATINVIRCNYTSPGIQKLYYTGRIIRVFEISTLKTTYFKRCYHL